VTCHRGAELRFGHYTSYVRGPQGAWFHADDEDMTPVPLAKVLNENTAYLLSYIRVGDSDQGPGARPTSTKSSPLPARPLANGHANGNGNANGNGHNNGTNGSAASPPSMKRKRQWTDDDDSQPATPSRAAHTPPPSDSDDEAPQERTPIKWTYGGNPKKSKGLLAPRAQNPESLKISPIDRPSHPSPVLDSPRRKKDKMRKKMKSGPPMPFKAGNGRNGSGGFPKGGKGRHGRGPFRG
jgi:ubiquitin carboxyl-terminal hydrolase 36/42